MATPRECEKYVIKVGSKFLAETWERYVLRKGFENATFMSKKLAEENIVWVRDRYKAKSEILKVKIEEVIENE